MTRLNTNAELWKALTQWGRMSDLTSTGLTTTLSAAEAVGQSTIGVAAVAGGAAADYVRIGDDKNYEVAQIEATASGPAFVMKTPIAYAHDSGEAVVELTRTDLGDISDDGVSVEPVGDRERVDFATQRHYGDYNIRHTDYRVTASLENMSPENIAAVMGIADANVLGAGTTADPHVTDWTPDNIDSIDPMHFWARGTLGNGQTVEVQFWDVRVDPSKTIQLARGQDAPMQLAFNSRHIRWLRNV